MKSTQKPSLQSPPSNAQKSVHSSALTAMAIGKKLLEIKRISGSGEMTEMNMALWRHLK